MASPFSLFKKKFQKFIEPILYNSMEEEILELRRQGKTYKEICEQVGCSKGTVSYYCGQNQKEKAAKRTQKRRKADVLDRKVENFLKPKNFVKKPETKTSPERLFYYKSKAFQGRGGKRVRDFSTKDVLDKYGQITECYLSGVKIDLLEPKTYQFDHIVPTSRGGSNNFSNLGIASTVANQAKSDLLVEEFIQLCKNVLEHNGYTVSQNG